MPSEPRVIQVTNVAPVATRDQMKNLFTFIGKLDELVLYPEAESSSTSTRVCYVKFVDPEDVGVALHLTNTVFIDRALIIVPVPDGKIPDEKTALGSQGGLGLYPALPASTELSKVDEIRRTVYVANIDSAVSPEILMQYFGTHAGEVKYARMAGEETFAVHAAFIEFTEQVSVMRALGLSGQVLGGRPLTVLPANTSIVKTTSSALGATSNREIEEAMRKVNEAQPLIDAVLDSEGDRHRGSRSRSHRSRSHRSRSRSRRSRSRRKSRSRSPRSRRKSSSRSPRRRSPSPRRKRSKSRTPDRKRSSRRSRSPRTKSRRDRDEKGSRSPLRAERDKEARRSGRDESSSKKEASRRKSSRSRSRSRGSRRDRDRDRNSGAVRDRSDRDRNRGKDHDGRDQRSDKKGRVSDEKSRRDRDGERKSSSSKHDRDRESSKKVPKVARNYDEEEQEGDASSDFEQQAEEEPEDPSGSDDNHSENDEQARESPGDANLSRLDMDVDSE